MLKINFLGDSITEGMNADKIEHTYVYLVGKMANCVTRNYGICGTRIARQRIPSDEPMFDRYFSSRVDEMNNDADYIFVFGGTNDYGHGDAPFGKMGDKTVDTFYGAVDFLINKLMQYYKKEQIIFIPPLYRTNENSIYGSHDSKTEPCNPLSVYREALMEVVNSYNIKTLDIKDIIGKAENNPLIDDGLHPNNAGHHRIAELISGYIKNILLKKAD